MSSQFESTLVIVRGLPGSGKSTLAREISRSCGYLHFENDHYFETEGGYVHDRRLQGEAQRWCYRSARDAILATKKVVVSNVFTKLSSMRDFLTLTDSVMVIECSGQFGNVHDVPPEVLKRMRDAWEPFPGAIHL